MNLFKRFGIACKAFVQAFKKAEHSHKMLEQPCSKETIKGDFSHLMLLQSLQDSARFIDFLKEDIQFFTDAQVGAAARKIHQDCASLIEELITLRPVKDESEGTVIQIMKGYDPSEIKVVGMVKGEPPYTGVLVHRGWKACKRSLPKRTSQQNLAIICPAEVEIKK